MCVCVRVYAAEEVDKQRTCNTPIDILYSCSFSTSTRTTPISKQQSTIKVIILITYLLSHHKWQLWRWPARSSVPTASTCCLSTLTRASSPHLLRCPKANCRFPFAYLLACLPIRERASLIHTRVRPQIPKPSVRDVEENCRWEVQGGHIGIARLHWYLLSPAAATWPQRLRPFQVFPRLIVGDGDGDGDGDCGSFGFKAPFEIGGSHQSAKKKSNNWNVEFPFSTASKWPRTTRTGR